MKKEIGVKKKKFGTKKKEKQGVKINNEKQCSINEEVKRKFIYNDVEEEARHVIEGTKKINELHQRMNAAVLTLQGKEKIEKKRGIKLEEIGES